MKLICTAIMMTALAFTVGDARVAPVKSSTKQGVGQVSQQRRVTANTATTINTQQTVGQQLARRRLLVILYILFANNGLFAAPATVTTTTVTSTSTVTTTGAVTGTTGPSTTGVTSAATTPMATFPAPFNAWYEYKGCRYKASTTAATDINAATACTNYGSGTTLAQKIVRTAADRLALFGNGLNLTPHNVWLGLKDADGIGPAPAKWLNGDIYADTTITPQYANSDTFSTIAYVNGPVFKDITLVYERTPTTHYYVCEYCP